MAMIDLRDYESCCNMIEHTKPDVIIHLAAKVGGVKGNTDLIGDFLSEFSFINLSTTFIALALFDPVVPET